MTTTPIRFAAALATIAVVVAGFLSFRNNRMDSLYAEAAGYPEYSNSAAEDLDAVRKLAAYQDRRATRLLLVIALGHAPAAQWGVREAAIKMLGERKDPGVSNALADLLQPHEALDTRTAAAAALQNLPCESECIRSVLHYLERVWRGEPNYEDRLWQSKSFQDVTINLHQRQQTLRESLYLVLRRHKDETIIELVRVYGLASDGPSTFALDLLPHLGLPESCPLPLKSDKENQQHNPEFYTAPRQELQAAIAALKCK